MDIQKLCNIFDYFVPLANIPIDIRQYDCK